MKRPRDAHDWADVYRMQAKKRVAQQARDERAAAKQAKQKKKGDVPHPLNRFVTPREEAEAMAVVEARRQAELHRGSQPHPLTGHTHIPIPAPPKPK